MVPTRLSQKNKEYTNARCPMVLGIDEHHFSKKQGYVTTLVNLSKRKVFDVLPGRSERELIPYLSKLQGKDKVRIVVMDLSDRQKALLSKYFETQPTVETVYETTQKLIELLNEKHCKYKDCKNRLVPMLINFIEALKGCGFEHFKKLGRTMESWQSEIGRMFRFSKSNGITEGFHRKMKLIQRRVYGFRSFINYSLRVRVLCA